MSDREMERFLQENTSGKWFFELDLGEQSPDHSYFGDFRKRLGTESLMAIFNRVREVFTFVDASHLVSKLNLQLGTNISFFR